jgi:hypothetical protein
MKEENEWQKQIQFLIVSYDKQCRYTTDNYLYSEISQAVLLGQGYRTAHGVLIDEYGTVGW